MPSRRDCRRAVPSALEPKGIRRILLVTSAIHMPRAFEAFSRAGFQVVPAPTDFRVVRPGPGGARGADSSAGAGLFQVLPDVENLVCSTRALREYYGLAMQRWRVGRALSPESP